MNFDQRSWNYAEKYSGLFFWDMIDWLIDWLIFIEHKTNVYAIVTIDKKTSTYTWYIKNTKNKRDTRTLEQKYNTRTKPKHNRLQS